MDTFDALFEIIHRPCATNTTRPTRDELKQVPGLFTQLRSLLEAYKYRLFGGTSMPLVLRDLDNLGEAFYRLAVMDESLKHRNTTLIELMHAFPILHPSCSRS